MVSTASQLPVLPGAERDRTCLLMDNLLLGPLVLWSSHGPLCNSAPRPRNTARVHAHKAQAVKVSSVHAGSLPLQKVNKNSSSWSIRWAGRSIQLSVFQKLTKILPVTVCNKLRGYLLEDTSYTHNKFNKEEGRQQLAWLNIHHIVIIWYWSYVDWIFIEFFSQLYFPLSREQLINNLSF